MRLVRLSLRTSINVDMVVRITENPVAEAGKQFRDVKVRYADGSEECFEGEEADALRIFTARNSEPADSSLDFASAGPSMNRPLVSKADG